MPVRSTSSSKAEIAAVAAALAPLAGLASAASSGTQASEETVLELRRIRAGHEAYLWGQDAPEDNV